MYSKRINTLFTMIPQDSTGVFDVGSDHGYLLLLLRATYPNLKLCGVENKKGPYENLCENTKNQNINTILSNGLENYSKDYNTVVIAGMGYNSIKVIINNFNNFDNIKYFLIDSHNFIYEIRKLFVDKGYKISNEKIIDEKGIYYELILFERGESSYNEKEYKYGPILLKEKNNIFMQKYSNIYNFNEKLLKNNNLSEEKINEIKNINKELSILLNK